MSNPLVRSISTKLTTLLRNALVMLFIIFLSACQSGQDEQTSPGAMTLSPLQKWHTLTLSFEGENTHEAAQINPFTDYRLMVKFTHEDKTVWVRGFYAADGDAANSGASEGNIWQVRFSPSLLGTWSYQAYLHTGSKIAVNRNIEDGQRQVIKNDTGQFVVVPSDKTGKDFRAHGKLALKGRYMGFKSAMPSNNSDDSGQEGFSVWLKNGANSPENFLAYYEFDGTYRSDLENLHDEAIQKDKLHHFDAHAKDWQAGDLTWANGRGKNIVGATNYLADMGMTSIYFLTMNINGDGKDVWPYTSYTERERFDVSKLEQWNLLFNHMQSKGLALHVVTQETENERLLDDGDVGFHRALYYQELIARFGHHLAIIWNLGEENGPVSWSPTGQSPEQVRAMAQYFKANDPYQNPVYVHTHASHKDRNETLPDVVGETALDGLSFQANHPHTVNNAINEWRQRAAQKGNDIQISMDEIGPAKAGLVPDNDDPNHDHLRQQVLWGGLMAGASGVEWYFGYKYPHHDLTSEDWRQRHNMWKQTNIASTFLLQYPISDMVPNNKLTSNKDDFVLANEGDVYLIYMPKTQDGNLVSLAQGQYSVYWFDPLNGGPLKSGTVKTVDADNRNIGTPNTNESQDWLAVLKRL